MDTPDDHADGEAAYDAAAEARKREAELAGGRGDDAAAAAVTHELERLKLTAKPPTSAARKRMTSAPPPLARARQAV
jgi:hypothetical protein